MNKEKCYEIIDNCKKEIEQIVNECDGYDGNSTFLALQLIKDLDRLRKCISIDVPIEQDFYLDFGGDIYRRNNSIDNIHLFCS